MVLLDDSIMIYIFIVRWSFKYDIIIFENIFQLSHIYQYASMEWKFYENHNFGFQVILLGGASVLARWFSPFSIWKFYSDMIDKSNNKIF